jgi:hypothetical protein
MITSNDLPIEGLTVGATTYPMVKISFNAFDSYDGMTVSVTANTLLAAAVTVNIIALYTGEEDIAAEIGGSTYFNVNTGLAATKKLGTMTMRFNTKLENTFTFKQGDTVGATTFPSLAPPQIALVFANVALNIHSVRVTRRNHPPSI